MIDDTLTPLNEEERERLARARADRVPPRALEERTVALLRERGLIRASRRPWLAAGFAAAAAALLALVLWAVPPRSTSTASAGTGPRYMLLLYAGADPVSGSAEARRREYSQWARDVSSSGVAITGEELSDEVRELGVSAGEPAALALPRGFFIVDAPDLASAERIASSCPHLRHGGRIVIKPIV
jgi:hypothetical protein